MGEGETSSVPGWTAPLRPIFAGAAFIVLLLGMRAAQDVLAPIFLDAVLAILFTPALRWLERRGLPGPLALLVLMLVLLAFLLLLFFVAMISLGQLEARLPLYQSLLIRRIGTLETALAGLGINLRESLNLDIANESTLVRTAITAVTGVLSNLVMVAFSLFLLFLLLASSRDLARKVRTGQARGNQFAQHFGTYARLIQRQYSIQALSNLLCAVCITITLLLFRVDFAFLWGFLVFLLAFIPNVGLTLATFPAILIALLLYGPITALIIAAIVIIVNAAMDNLVTPRFLGAGLNLPMLPIFLSFLLWSWVFGFLGALLAVPATLLVRILLGSHPATRHLTVFLEKNDSSGQR